ncbi:MAG TPA: hypothetical protein VK213_05620 [Bacteroidales bacterium]|nr:hypothetical protein [Bacteroidales bacterium]
MKRVVVLSLLMAIMIACFGQENEPKQSKTSVGFSFNLPRGMAPSTALTNSGEPIEKGYGFGVILQRNIMDNLKIFFDINLNNYNNKIGEQGSDVQTIWSVAESATHWDEPGAPHILYVHNLPTDVHFDMQSTGLRLGLKYYFGANKIRPWAGAGFGFYQWNVNYFNGDKKQTYGTDEDYVTGLTYMLGFDFKIMDDTFLSLFADLASPVAKYNIEGLFYPQWDITDYQAHIMGPYRFGVTLSFGATKK